MAEKPVRLGFVGLGGRGQYHLDCALGIPGVEVPALCEIVDSRLQQSAKWVAESGRPAPRLYGRGPKDFERLCAEEQLDCVICSTSWEWHAPICLAANRNGKHCSTEVPCVLTLDEAWALVESFEKTGKWSRWDSSRRCWRVTTAWRSTTWFTRVYWATWFTARAAMCTTCGG